MMLSSLNLPCTCDGSYLQVCSLFCCFTIFFSPSWLFAGKNPPLDLLFESPDVVPVLIQKLQRIDLFPLQFEAAWCLTNIACGEHKHIATLIDHNVVPYLAQTIGQHAPPQILQQSLWALCNLSNDEYACRSILQHPTIIVLALFHIGIQCFPHEEFFPANSWPEYWYPFSPRHRSMNENPQLGTLRQVTFLLGNIFKLRQPLHPPLYRCILFAFADLLHSPDDEIILDICQTLAIACQQQPHLIQLVLEEGILSRFKELLDSQAHHEMALVAVCVMLRSPWLHHRRTILLHFLSDSTGSGDGRDRPFIARLLWALTNATNTTTRRDIVGAIHAIVELGNSMQENAYIVELLAGGVYTVLAQLVDQGSYDLKTESGGLLIALLQRTGCECVDGNVFVVLTALLTCTDPAIVLLALQTMEQLLVHLLRSQRQHEGLVAGVASSANVQSAVDLVMWHPLPELASQAERVNRRLRLLRAAEEDEDDE